MKKFLFRMCVFLHGILFINGVTYALDIANSIDKILTSNADRTFNGVLLIAKDNQVLYLTEQGIYGVSNDKINKQFAIGSISKQFTSAIIMRLVDKGLINLEKSLKDYLPNIKSSWADKVKVKHLLNHTSGIVDLKKPLEFSSGTKFMYSPGLTYYLISKIAEKVSKKTYSELLNEMFSKANMLKSGIISSANMQENYIKNPNLITAYREEKNKILQVTEIGEDGDLFNSTLIPGGGIISTANDLLAWNLAFHNDRKLLSNEAYKQIVMPSSKREHPRYGNISYGFGVQLVSEGGSLEVSHSGYIDGYIATLIYYPRTKISVICLENISWDTGGIKRMFMVHDQIRNVVRKAASLR